MVSAKAYRDGWQRDPKHCKTRADQPKPVLPVAPIPDVQHRDDEPALRKRAGQYITTRNVRRRECRWIPGEPYGDSPMCGAPISGHGWWCAYHDERAHG